MVLSPPAPGPLPRVDWFTRIEVALQLSTRGVLTLVDHAVPGQLRTAWLRLLAIDPGVQLVVTAKALFDLPDGALVLYAPDPGTDGVTLNMMRPIVADRRYRIVLWCEDGIAAALLQHAPDFFDWITARVDCPWRPMPHALATIVAAHRTRTAAIVWNGPRIEETLGWLRPNRPFVRVSVDDYGAMVEAMRPRTPSWLCIENVVDEHDAQRVAWAFIEAGRRMPVFVLAAWGVSNLNQRWFEIHELRPTAPIRSPLWLALKSEPTAVQVARQLPVPVPDAALERALLAAEDPGPLYAQSISTAFDSPHSWPLWVLLRRPCPLRGVAATLHDERCKQWGSLDGAGRAELAFDACQFDVARWAVQTSGDRIPCWLVAALSWSAGRPREAAEQLTACEESAPPVFTTRLARELEQITTPDDDGEDFDLRIQQETAVRGQFHVVVMDLHLERAAMRLATSEPSLAKVDLRVATFIARKIFRDREHPERAKAEFLEAVLRAKEGDLSAAASLAEHSRAVCRDAYPPEHSSHRALTRLLTEIELRRGHVATWTHYATRALPDEPRTWWMRPAFSLRYAAPKL